jgi:hypothetical protein
VGLAINVLDCVGLIHASNALIGDVNAMNILVESERSVYLVDCDSYQVGRYPCPVGAINFVAPELQGLDLHRHIRNMEHELFAIATLLFMILMPGKPPYSHQGGGDGAANIRRMHFPYALGEKPTDGAPLGAWRLCWSHLNRPLKDAFHRTFHADYRGKPRTTVNEWICLLKEYQEVLSRPNATFRGPKVDYGFDLSILPHNRRYVRGRGKEPPLGGPTDLQRAVRRMAASSQSNPSADGPGALRQSDAKTNATKFRPNVGDSATTLVGLISAFLGAGLGRNP